MPTQKIQWKKAHALSITIDLDELVEYVTEIHEALHRSHESLKVRAKEHVASAMDEDDQQEMSISYIDPDHKLGEVFPAMCSASTFVAIYSFFEHEMVRLCGDIQERRALTIVLKDLAGRGIEQAVSYLEKICEIKEPKKIKFWPEIKILREVRNVIVHRRGVLKEEELKNDPDASLRKYVKSRPSITVDAMNTLTLSKEYCLHAITIIRKFLLELVSKLPASETFEQDIR